ncbi:hypothetical protein [Streptomyces sp. NPDC005374]|uniref:hypothetical protein n=1 Tax=Streptomyces sp. NPDC005374 TaxID=3364713 RepID=UPI0036C23EDA
MGAQRGQITVAVLFGAADYGPTAEKGDEPVPGGKETLIAGRAARPLRSSGVSAHAGAAVPQLG